MNNDEKIDLTDGQVFRNLFDRYYVPLCVFAERYVEDEELASDIVQDCFAGLWQKQSDFQFVYQVRSFMYTCVRNSCLNELEHRRVVSGYQEKTMARMEESTFHDRLIEEEMHRVVMEAVDKLPRQSRNIIRLALENNSNAEIADKLSVSKETVHTLKKGAYKNLRALLKDYYYFVLFL
ncbi:RNA polymerase sigma-70 factor [Parabacteroides sp.]